MDEDDSTWRMLGSFTNATEENEEITWIYDKTANKYSLHVLCVSFSFNILTLTNSSLNRALMIFPNLVLSPYLHLFIHLSMLHLVIGLSAIFQPILVAVFHLALVAVFHLILLHMT